MRKNGINCELRFIDGGICAVDGFKAGGVCCGLKNEENNDLAMIVAERKCRTACVYSLSPVVGAPIPVTKKHLANGLAQAILVNGGAANVFLSNGEALADGATRLVEKYHNIAYDDVIIASTGVIGKPITMDNFDRGIAALRVHLGTTREYSKAAADAITSNGEKAKHFAFSFHLGDFPCKIAGIYKGKMHVSPNMATTLVFLVTDVNISQAMLSRALAAETRETLNMLALDGEPSPNDMACIMTTCKAGNYIIDCVDSEYAKFTRALRAVLTYICEGIASEGMGRTIRCQLLGAKSKPLARLIAKRIATSSIIKSAVARNEIDIDGIMFLLTEFEGINDYSKVQIFLQSADKKMVIYEDERRIVFSDATMRQMLSATDLIVGVRIGNGNYGAIAYGSAIL